MTIKKYRASVSSLLCVILTLAVSVLLAQDSCENDDCVTEDDHPGYHLHFSSQDVDLYEETPDTLYQDADWPSKLEEYSDYLSR